MVQGTSPKDEAELACPLCSAALWPVIARGEHWLVVLNRNQNLLGKALVVLARHEEKVTGLTADEWVELQLLLDRTTRVIAAAFSPDHYNYAFLQNQDRHTHLHVVPRYATTRTVVGCTFKDSTWPDHYAVGESFLLDNPQLERLAEVVAGHW